MSNVVYEERGPVAIVTIDRPKVRNCVDGATAAELAGAFEIAGVGGYGRRPVPGSTACNSHP